MVNGDYDPNPYEQLWFGKLYRHPEDADLNCCIRMLKMMQEGILSRNRLSRKVHATWSGFLSVFQEKYGGKNCLLFSWKKPLTICKRHRIVINKLEIGAVGTDFSRRTSWWPGRARTWKSMQTCTFLKCRHMQKKNQNYIFLDESECVLNEKMMPDVTIPVPELEIVKQHRS
jgi:hypothetical protein